jgi:Domain of unknown function (DUF4160)
MPTVVRVAGIRFVVWPNDHAPPHAHAFGSDWEVIVSLGDCESIKPWLRDVVGNPTPRDLRAVLLAADRHCMTLTKAWRKIHG